MGARWIEPGGGVPSFQDELADKIRDHSFRVTLEDCYDLPESDYQIREVELTKEQKLIYSQLRDRAVAILSDTEKVTADLVITQLLRMHQVLSGPQLTRLGRCRPSLRTGLVS